MRRPELTPARSRSRRAQHADATPPKAHRWIEAKIAPPASPLTLLVHVSSCHAPVTRTVVPPKVRMYIYPRSFGRHSSRGGVQFRFSPR